MPQYRKTCCGTCAHWSQSQISGEYHFCAWQPPELPFWATLEQGDHGDWTTAEQGRACPAWRAPV